MCDIVDRVAKSLFDIRPHNHLDKNKNRVTPDWHKQPQDIKNVFIAQATCAIRAMKKPISDEMIEAGTWSRENGRNVSEVFDDMIDAALGSHQ